MKKYIFIAIGLILVVAVIGIFEYLASGVSAVYPPIREYRYSGTINQLIGGLNKYTGTNSNARFKITDTTGNKLNGYAIYIDIEEENIKYNLKCEEHSSNSSLGETIIKLVGSYDKSRNLGGYSKEANGVKELADEFDMQVVKSLKNNQNIQLHRIN